MSNTTPWWWKTKFDTSCPKCQKAIPAGSKCFWDKSGNNRCYHYECRLSDNWIAPGSNFDETKTFAILKKKTELKSETIQLSDSDLVKELRLEITKLQAEVLDFKSKLLKAEEPKPIKVTGFHKEIPSDSSSDIFPDYQAQPKTSQKPIPSPESVEYREITDIFY